MRTEAIKFQRCCVCIPLRYGLITWGYLRLLLSSLILIGVSYGLSQVTKYRDLYHSTNEIKVYSVTLIVVTADIVMGIIFIYGCHKKNAMFIKKYYYHNICLLTLFIAIFCYNATWELYLSIKYGGHGMALEIILYFILDILTYITYIILQTYVTLLVRSQFVKLENACQFRFENNAIEAECSLKISDSEVTADCDRKDPNDSDEQRRNVQIDV